jgi:hypothetical protein
MEGLNIHATAKVKLTKLDSDGNILAVEEKDINLTKEEAEALWRSQPQA